MINLIAHVQKNKLTAFSENPSHAREVVNYLLVVRDSDRIRFELQSHSQTRKTVSLEFTSSLMEVPVTVGSSGIREDVLN